MLKFKINSFRGLLKVPRAFFAMNMPQNINPMGASESKIDLNPNKTSIQPWLEADHRLSNRAGELLLSQNDKIEQYVLNVIKGYFRTTYKEGITLETDLQEHGLDSLDAIELCMILEDELGYIIEAEIMPKFTKPKHYVNYIKQMEAYKKEHLMLPQLRAHMNEENWNEWMPGGESLKKKLFSYVKKDGNKADKKDASKSEAKVAKH